jgi:lytic cellulose monooxygenase (C1-hydroxylating)
LQQLSVNGKSAGQMNGLRAPTNNNPVQDVTSNSMICGQPGASSKTVIDVAPGDKIGAYWQHIVGGAQGPNDHDNPIAKSHKGPVMAYLAKVDNAATAGLSGLKWFKIADDGFDTGNKQWGVDRMMANNGWSYFNMPKCVAPGQYLLRVEILALHSAKNRGAAQFYQSCAQIKVSGSGTFSPSSTVSFPGAYSAQDPGILINIYGLAGQPDMGGKQYNSPGPKPITC